MQGTHDPWSKLCRKVPKAPGERQIEDKVDMGVEQEHVEEILMAVIALKAPVSIYIYITAKYNLVEDGQGFVVIKFDLCANEYTAKVNLYSMETVDNLRREVTARVIPFGKTKLPGLLMKGEGYCA